MASLKEILSWFEKNKYPTQEQFKESWTSFWHKLEKMPMEQVVGLQDELSNKALKSDLNAVETELKDKASKEELANVVAGLVPMGSVSNLAELEAKPKRNNDAYYVEDQLSPEGDAYIYRWDEPIQQWINTKQVVFGGGNIINFLRSNKDLSITLQSTKSILSGSKLRREYVLEDIGDFIELEVALINSSGNSNDLFMFQGNKTSAGFYKKEFYFRSNSEESSDYRRWKLPDTLKTQEFNIIKLLVVEDGWELFINGASMGVRPISSNCFINKLLGIQDNVSYAYKYLTLKSKSLSSSYSTYDIGILAYGVFETRINSSLINKLSEDISGLTIDIRDNTNFISYIQKEDYYSSLYRNDEDELSYIELSENGYIISDIGDYFEIEARYWGNSTNWIDKMAIVQSQYQMSRFGWYKANDFWFKIFNEDYIKWDTSDYNINYSEWNKYKLLVVKGGWELSINGVSMGVKPRISDNILKLKYIGSFISSLKSKYDVKALKVVSQQSGSLESNLLALLAGANNVDIIKKEYQIDPIVPSNFKLAPKCLVSYNGSNLFEVYLRDDIYQDIYYMIPIHFKNTRGTKDDSIWNQYLWQLDAWGRVFTYDAELSTMTDTGKTIITGGESECVFKYTDKNGLKADFTGGVHGDETLDKDNSCFVDFYMNGIKVDLSKPFHLVECCFFEYVQKTALHDTAVTILNKDTLLPVKGNGEITVDHDHLINIDGVKSNLIAYKYNKVLSTEEAAKEYSLYKSENNSWVIKAYDEVYENHPIIGYHLKKTTFKNNSYITENSLIFNSDREVNLWYHGICCLSKDFATTGYSEDLIKHEFKSENPNITYPLGYRRFNSFNSKTNLSAKIESWITDGGNVIKDDEAEMFIVDRFYDSKYYRTIRKFKPIPGSKITSVMEVTFNSLKQMP